MNVQRVVRVLALVVILGISAQSFASDSAAFNPVVFEQQRKDLVSEIQNGSRYADLTNKQRQGALDALASIGRLMRGVTSIDEMNGRNKVALFNLQEKVNTLLTDADPDKMVECRREKVVGSHLPHHICKTLAERRLESETSLDFVRKTTQPKPGASGG